MTSSILEKKIARIPLFVWILCLIVLAGIFFRTYHFEEWLLFKGDAFRDAVLVSHIPTEGVGSLPLLGPRAAKTILRLGPAFYYFQGLSVTLFDRTDAPVLAYPDLLFSILALPLCFVFMRRYFSLGWSLAISSMLSFSFMAIEYGRFAWNPNSVPFFTLLLFYSVLRVYDDNEKYKLFFAGLAGFSLGIASQLHFTAFLGLPIILFLFVILNRTIFKRFLSWKIFAVFFAMLLFIYIPVLANEWITSGDNTVQFFSALSSKADSHGLLQNIKQNFVMFSHYFLRILTGIETGHRFQYIVALCILLGGFITNLLLYRSNQEVVKRQFLLLTLLFSIIYFLLYIPLSFNIDRSRFFLPLLFLPYIYIGYIYTYFLQKKWKILAQWSGTVAVIIILLSNISFTNARFVAYRMSHISTSEFYSSSPKSDQKYWWTWGHFMRAADTVHTLCHEDIVTIMMSKDTRELDHSIEYAFRLIDKNKIFLIKGQKSTLVDKGCYFFISPPNTVFPKFIAESIHDESIDRGGILITRWYPENANEAYQVDEDKSLNMSLERKIKTHRRFFLRDVIQ